VSSGRALGLGLLAGGIGVAILMLAWLAVSGAQAGGIILGLLLLFAIGGPLVAGGIYVLSQQKPEAEVQAAFTSKRRVLESDRLFRRELAAELRQVAARPNAPAAALGELAEGLERKSYDSSEWYDVVQLTDGQLDVLQRYDDLAWERVRWLQDNANAPSDLVDDTVRDLRTTLGQRRDLLLRGREAPTAAPSAMLRAGEPRRDAAALRDLSVGDAVSHERDDYVVEGVATYFAQGQTWKLAHLVPSGPGAASVWLYVSPGALDAALLSEVPAPQAPDITGLAVAGTSLPATSSGSATVDVASKAGSARGVLVSYAIYASNGTLGLAEQWPDGARHAYAGPRVSASDLDIWPATVRS
jgi:hypothetical protein